MHNVAFDCGVSPEANRESGVRDERLPMPSPARDNAGPSGGVNAAVLVAISRDDSGLLLVSCWQESDLPYWLVVIDR